FYESMSGKWSYSARPRGFTLQLVAVSLVRRSSRLAAKPKVDYCESSKRNVASKAPKAPAQKRPLKGSKRVADVECACSTPIIKPEAVKRLRAISVSPIRYPICFSLMRRKRLREDYDLDELTISCPGTPKRVKCSIP
ncbi:hypothetical protein ROZALSC1DRAFT_25738, partial [Rozella allomycis CSF55]